MATGACGTLNTKVKSSRYECAYIASMLPGGLAEYRHRVQRAGPIYGGELDEYTASRSIFQQQDNWTLLTKEIFVYILNRKSYLHSFLYRKIGRLSIVQEPVR
jgi:hypothetical protein